MSEIGLAALTLEVNDQVVPYKPNSLVYKDGFGDVIVRHQTTGGEAGDKVITVDAESKVGMVNFAFYTTVTNTERLKDWLRRSQGAGNIVRLSGSGFTRSFRNMYITEEPETPIGSETEIEISFEGDVAS